MPEANCARHIVGNLRVGLLDLGPGVLSPLSIESSTMLGSKLEMGNAFWRLNPTEHGQLIALIEFLVKEGSWMEKI
jgi:hypothetical protein